MREIIENNHDDHEHDETAWSIVLMQIILRDRSVEIEQWNYFLAFKYHNKRMESF